MSAPRWSRALLRRLAPPGRADEVIGDLEEAHAVHMRRRGRLVGGVASALETFDIAFALLRQRGVSTGVSLLDFKLGLRMLVRYPGLTTLGGLALAFAIFAGAGTFEFLSQVAYPTLPFEGGDRLVGIQLWDAREGDDYDRTLYDLGVWQSELTTVEDLGAFASVVRNLIVDGAGAHLVRGAAMDPAGFRVTGVEPHLGRTLTEADQRPDAPLAVVLGYRVWQNVFAGDPDVLGRVVGVGIEAATVVGVMPEGFTFPATHELWIPLRADPRAVEPGEGPAVFVFGRLAEGTSISDAQREVGRFAERLSTALPATHEHVRARVQPYARAMLGLPASFSDRLVSTVAMAWNIPLVLFLTLVCGNVALLMFARAAARESELVVRSALGAGRRRIVGQLFAEALVLATLAAVVGLSLAGYGLRWGYHIVEVELWEGPLPFWFAPELSLQTVVYTLALTFLAATVAGVVPALKATRGLGDRLRQASAGGGGVRFGGLWTAVIVTQVAVTVVFPVVAFSVATEGREIETFDMGIPAERYLTAQIAIEPPQDPPADSETASAEFQAQVRVTLADLEQRLLADPAVAGVTFTERAPRLYNGWNEIEMDVPSVPTGFEWGHRLGAVSVETDFFATLGVEPRIGRDFHSGDGEVEPGVVIVNEAFVEYVLGGRNPVGAHLRYVISEAGRAPNQEPGPWLEIVGVVQDLGKMSGYSSAVIYHPVPPNRMNPTYAIIHARSDAGGFVPRLREIAFDVDPTLRIRDTVTLDRIVESEVAFYRFWIFTLLAGSTLAVVLSLGGIYAVMAFTVARRTREIGVRVALGAPGRRVVLSVFRRPLIQLSAGLLAGGLLASVLLGVAAVDTTVGEAAAFAAYMLVMLAVCLMACVAPTRRALAVEPSEALRAE